VEFDLVFEGGGAKGMVFVGALQEYLSRGHTPGRLLGTSAGAIAAALVAAGYDEQEMLDALNEKVNGVSVFETFMGEPAPFSDEEIEGSALGSALSAIDLPLIPDAVEPQIDRTIARSLMTTPRFRNALCFIERGGWYSADAFVDWMRAKLNSGSHNGQPRDFGDMTLAGFHQATGADLTVVAANTTAASILILNHRTAPNCPVVWAVRMSMSIPLLWEEVIWQPEWGTYRGRMIAGHRVVDGGLLSGFPLALFVSSDANVTDVMGEKQSPNVIGLLIDELMPVENAPPPSFGLGEGMDLRQTLTGQRLIGLLNTMLMAHDSAVIESFSQLVVRLPAKGYGTVEFDMGDERRGALVEAGRAAMAAYLDRIEAAPPSFDIESRNRMAQEADNIATRILGE
jgi:NTE family protein